MRNTTSQNSTQYFSDSDVSKICLGNLLKFSYFWFYANILTFYKYYGRSNKIKKYKNKILSNSMYLFLAFKFKMSIFSYEVYILNKNNDLNLVKVYI